MLRISHNGSRTSASVRVGILSAVVAATLPQVGCAISPDAADDEGGVSALAGDPAPKEVDFFPKKKAIMERSRYDLARIADALGYGWVSGCGPDVAGENMYLTLPDVGDSSWDPTNNPSETCDGFMARNRTQIKYTDWRAYQAAIHYGTPQVKTSALEEIDQIIYDPSPTPFKASPSKTYSVTNSVTNRKVDTVKTGLDFSVEFSAAPFGLGAKSSTKLSVGYEHAWDNAVLDSRTSTLSAVATYDVPANTRLIVHVFREHTTSDVYYTTKHRVVSDVKFNGFLRWRDCGGNWHKNHRGSGERPTFVQTFGNGTSLAFWQDIDRQKSQNLGPFDWNGMMSNKECFDHGAYVNAGIADLNSAFTDERVNEFTFQGALEEISGTRISLKPEFVKPQ